MLIFNKSDTKLIAYGLTLKEYSCNCTFISCTATIISKEFIKCWCHFRKSVNLSCWVNSGCRCPQWNYAEGGSDKSKHLLGMAIDISTINLLKVYTKTQLGDMAGYAGFTYWYFGDNFMHMDCYKR